MNLTKEEYISIIEAFHKIIEGKDVKRGRHDLHHKEIDFTKIFIRELINLGFIPITVEDANVDIGFKSPAFYLEDGTAYFGWIFWEKFSDKFSRKLWGSVIRNEKGDWEKVITSVKKTILYVNTNEKYVMDIEYPSDF